MDSKTKEILNFVARYASQANSPLLHFILNESEKPDESIMLIDLMKVDNDCPCTTMRLNFTAKIPKEEFLIDSKHGVEWYYNKEEEECSRGTFDWITIKNPVGVPKGMMDLCGNLIMEKDSKEHSYLIAVMRSLVDIHQI